MTPLDMPHQQNPNTKKGRKNNIDIVYWSRLCMVGVRLAPPPPLLTIRQPLAPHHTFLYVAYRDATN